MLEVLVPELRRLEKVTVGVDGAGVGEAMYLIHRKLHLATDSLGSTRPIVGIPYTGGHAPEILSTC
jgi:hypothetical protein